MSFTDWKPLGDDLSDFSYHGELNFFGDDATRSISMNPNSDTYYLIAASRFQTDGESGAHISLTGSYNTILSSNIISGDNLEQKLYIIKVFANKTVTLTIKLKNGYPRGVARIYSMVTS